MELRGNISAELLAIPLSQFKDRPVLTEYLKSLAVQLQELEIVYIQLYLLRTLDYATGVQLDGLGDIVGELRESRTDTDYRAAIASKVLINKSSASIPEILTIFTSVQDRLYYLREILDATIELEILGSYNSGTDPGLQSLNKILQTVKAGGVRADLLYHTATDDTVLELSPIPDTTITDALKGLSNEIGDTGGYLADVVE